VLDGEVICADETGRPIFLDLLRRRNACFVAFDVLWLNGEDQRQLALVERKKRLRRLLRWRVNHLISEAMAVEGRGCQNYWLNLAEKACVLASEPRPGSTRPRAQPMPHANLMWLCEIGAFFERG
jgi:hypothetical protein